MDVYIASIMGCRFFLGTLVLISPTHFCKINFVVIHILYVTSLLCSYILLTWDIYMTWQPCEKIKIDQCIRS